MRSLTAVVLLPLAACGGPDVAEQVLHTESHAYHIDLAFSPAEPVAGEDVTATAHVQRHDDLSPVTGAQVVFEPWMPMHDHGIPDEVVVNELDGGVYEGTFAFSMPGSWELRIDIGGDVATGSIEVQ